MDTPTTPTRELLRISLALLGGFLAAAVPMAFLYGFEAVFGPATFFGTWAAGLISAVLGLASFVMIWGAKE